MTSHPDLRIINSINYIIYMPKLPFHEGALLQVETEFPRQANFGILSQGVQHVTQYAV